MRYITCNHCYYSHEYDDIDNDIDINSDDVINMLCENCGEIFIVNHNSLHE